MTDRFIKIDDGIIYDKMTKQIIENDFDKIIELLNSNWNQTLDLITLVENYKNELYGGA